MNRRQLAPLVLAVLIPGIAAAQCIPSFDAPRRLNIPEQVIGAADFDGDGKPDLLASNGATTNAIYLHGSERVALPSDHPTSIMDVNNDGRPDIVSFIGGFAITILINNGNATFTRKTTTLATANVTVIMDEFNGDHFPDLAVVSPVTTLPYGYWIVQLWLGNGDGTFRLTPDVVADIFPNEQSFFRAIDADGDGRADLINVQDGYTPAPRLTIRRSLGSSFAAKQVGPPSASNLWWTADFDRDGHGDALFSPDGLEGSWPMVLNFGTAFPISRASVPPATGYRVSDYNGDGVPDLLRTNSPGLVPDVVRILINDGHANFQERQALPGILFGNLVSPADADGDGIADIIQDNFVMHGNGDGTFRTTLRTPLARTTVAFAGDFDGDGDDDVAMPSAIAWNNGDNTFQVKPVSDPRLARLAGAADVDGDGKSELIAFDGFATVVLSPRPDGSIGEMARINTPATAVAVGDFTGTHQRELAVLTNITPGLDTLGLSVYPIRGGAAPRFTMPLDGPAQGIAAADLNGDGIDDIVVSGGRTVTKGSALVAQDGFFTELLSTGTSFQPERRTTFATSAFAGIVRGDFDGDGRTDLAFAPLSGTEVNVLFGDGTGGFPRRQTFAGGAAIQAFDFNSDGRSDLAVVSPTFFGDHLDLLLGSAAGLVPKDSYFAARGQSMLVRAHRGATPVVMVALPNFDEALVYHLSCSGGRPRAVRR